MRINLEIVGFSSVEDSEKCTALNEKIIVTDMMLRRRLTRNARIALYLCDVLGDTCAPVVIGNAYGEVVETYDILKVLRNGETVSPTGFQNSVHNTPASYLSIVNHNKGYITTVSDLANTSASVLTVGAVKSLKYGSVLLIVTDAVDFEDLDEINRCGITTKECGVALLVRHTSLSPTIVLENKHYRGYSPSAWMMLEVIEKTTQLQGKTAIISVEI
jgi:hypothetical protein